MRAHQVRTHFESLINDTTSTLNVYVGIPFWAQAFERAMQARQGLTCLEISRCSRIAQIVYFGFEIVLSWAKYVIQFLYHELDYQMTI